MRMSGSVLGKGKSGCVKLLTAFCLTVTLLLFVLPCSSADVDPILIDKPSPYVYECGENLFLEVLVAPIMDYATGGRRAKENFFFLTVEVLFLENTPWNGMDKSSFVLKHTDPSGVSETYPLNYMMTMMMGMKSGWKTLADRLKFGTLFSLYLVFDIPLSDKQGWSLVFQPAQRGGRPVCETEVPLRVR